MTDDDQPRFGYVQRHQQLPSGAIVIHPSKIFEMQKKTIDNWTPSREMALLKFGSNILGGMAAVCGAVFIGYFRKRLLLKNQARMVSYAPTIFFPSVVTFFTQQSQVSFKIMSGEVPCPTCMDVRAVSIQLSAGVFQPFLLSLIASTGLAKITSSYPMPSLRDWRLMHSVLTKLCQPIKFPAFVLTGASVVGTVFMVHEQAKAVEKINRKLLEDPDFVSQASENSNF